MRATLRIADGGWKLTIGNTTVTVSDHSFVAPVLTGRISRKGRRLRIRWVAEGPVIEGKPAEGELEVI